MVVSLRRSLRRLVFVLLLVALTCSLFLLLRLFSDWLRYPAPYAEPQGHAVKVFEPLLERRQEPPLAERLRLFFAIGE